MPSIAKAPDLSECARKKPWPEFMFASSISAPALGPWVSASMTRPVMRLTSAWTVGHGQATRIDATSGTIRRSRRDMGCPHGFGEHDDRESGIGGALGRALEHADAPGFEERPAD